MCIAIEPHSLEGSKGLAVLDKVFGLMQTESGLPKATERASARAKIGAQLTGSQTSA